MGFLGQFYCHPERLPLPGLLCLQIYQILEDYDPLPVVMPVPIGAAVNITGAGIAKPGVRPHEIGWDYRPDPDIAEDWQTDLAESKAGGVCYFWDCIRPGEQLVLQLGQEPGGFNFGGYSLVVAADGNGRIRAVLG